MEPVTGVGSIWIKLVGTVFAGFYFVQNNKVAESLTVLVAIVLLDTILGTLVAIKLKKFSSWGMSRFAKKITYYAIAMLTVYCSTKAMNFGFDAIYFVSSYLILTEAISNFEKLKILDVPIPTKLLTLLNSDFADKEKMKDKWANKVDGLTTANIVAEYLKNNPIPAEAPEATNRCML